MYVDVIRRFLSLIFRINSSPRHGPNRSRYQKSPGNFASPMSWDHVHRVWWQSGGKLQRSISNSRAWFFKQPWIADFLLAEPMDMQCEICSAQWDLYGTEFHMNTCKHVWAIHQVFKLCSRGRRRGPCATRVPASVASGRQQIPTCVRISRVFEHC